ncbi:MAG TPA: hypothetical protein VMC06_09240 [Opitutaceae bacterium]|nr:hypothetical protein [Opitutaceae bacterium]
MKIRIFALFLLAAGPALVADAAGWAKPDSAPTVPLPVTVQPPANPSVLWSDHVSRVLADYVEFGFKEAGFHGQFNFLGRPGVQPAGTPRLELNLVDWHPVKPGTIDCTFTARLITATGSHDLGKISGTADDVTAWFDPVIRTNGILSSAETAGRRLYRALAAQKLLPIPAA